MSLDDVAGRVRERRHSTLPQRATENFLKQGLKQGLLMHSEQIVKCVEVDTGLLCLCNVYPGNIEISMQISFEKRQA